MMIDINTVRFACILVMALSAALPALARADQDMLDGNAPAEVEVEVEVAPGLPDETTGDDFGLSDGNPGADEPDGSAVDGAVLPADQDLLGSGDAGGTSGDGLEGGGGLEPVEVTDLGGDDGVALDGTDGDFTLDDGMDDHAAPPDVDDCGEACMFYTTGLPDQAGEAEPRGVTTDFGTDLESFDSAADYLDTGPDDALTTETVSPHTALLAPAAPDATPRLIRGGRLSP